MITTSRLTKVIINHKRIFISLITAAAVLIAVVGSWQYYSSPEYSDYIVRGRLISTVLFSTLKLFSFSPTVSAGTPTPFLYEAAKWICPLCTGYWVFSAVETILRNRIEKISRKFKNKKQIAIYGINKESMGYIHSQKNKRSDGHAGMDIHFVIIPDRILEREERLELERQHILVEDMIFEGYPENEKDSGRFEKFFNLFSEIVLFSEDAMKNYMVLRQLEDYLMKYTEDVSIQEFCCLMRCEDRQLERLILERQDKQKGKAPIDLYIFDPARMAVRELFSREPIFEPILDGLSFQEGEKEPDLLYKIPEPHIFIAGFGKLGQAVLHEALLTGDLTPFSRIKGYEKLRVTIVDHDKEGTRSKIKTMYPAIEKICNINIIAADALDRDVETELSKYPMPTYAAICFSDPSINIGMFRELTDYLNMRHINREHFQTGNLEKHTDCGKYLPVAVYIDKNERELLELMGYQHGGYCRLIAFGGMEHILNRSNIVDSRIEQEAMSFNYAYLSLQGIGHLATPMELWKKLDHEKRASNRAQAANRRYIRRILDYIPALPQKDEIILCAADTDKILSKLREYPTLDQLACWEHRRWNNFHYASGYIGYDPDPSNKGQLKPYPVENGDMIYGKVHNCLIDDWEELKRNETSVTTVIYDIYAIYACAENGDDI